MENFDKHFKKAALSTLIFGALLAVATFASLSYLCRSIESEKAEIEANIGKKIVVEKDTLLVIDYSRVFKTYKLSNGVEYSIDFVKPRIIK